MKRRLRLAIASAALALHVLAPFVAYASARPLPGFNDLCSVYGNTGAAGVEPVGLPAPYSDRHLLSHCALCPGGSAAVAVLPPVVALPLLLPAGKLEMPVVVSAAAAAAPIFLPPPRGPPASIFSA
jgi:hypothetical protein